MYVIETNDRLRALRAQLAARGLSIKEVAEAAGYNVVYVRNVLAGRKAGRPCVEALEAALEALDLTERTP